jgi:pimeloyl-ACP methyl ester carboxylesterase
MDSLVLSLPNGGRVTGLVNFPQIASPTTKYRPLLVCLHGGTYSSSYFDVPDQSIRSVSDAVQVPIVAINRAGYFGSSMVGDNGAVPEGSSYQEEEGKWLHEQVLPSLWKSYADMHKLTCLVILTHSLGTPPAIVAIATQHAELEKGEDRKYNIGGLILSGWGFTPPPNLDEAEAMEKPTPRPTRFNFPPEQKTVLMLGSPDDGLCDPKIYAVKDGLGTEIAFDEIDHGRTLWFKKAQKYTEQVGIPILHALGEYDLLWPPAAQKANAYELSFPRSPKIEGGVLLDAPHCIELSFQWKAWYVKALGFALECAGAYKNT